MSFWGDWCREARCVEPPQHGAWWQLLLLLCLRDRLVPLCFCISQTGVVIPGVTKGNTELGWVTHPAASGVMVPSPPHPRHGSWR